MRKINKSKEQIVKGMQDVQKVKEMRAFVKDVFYPQLLTTTTSIDDAKFLLGSFSNMLMEQFFTKMKEIKFEELKLETKLDSTSPQFEEYKKVLALFTGRDIYSSRELIEGMKSEIEMMILNEMKKRKLETLETNFLE